MLDKRKHCYTGICINFVVYSENCKKIIDIVCIDFAALLLIFTAVINTFPKFLNLSCSVSVI